MVTIPSYKQSKTYRSFRGKYQRTLTRTGGTQNSGAKPSDPSELRELCFFIDAKINEISQWLGLHKPNFNKYNIDYAKMNKQIKTLYLNVMKTAHKIIGDPRVGIRSADGLVPKGGTGYLRLSMRTRLSTQYNKNHGFPASMDLVAPVKYAKRVNDLPSHSLQHASIPKTIQGRYKKRIYNPAARRIIGYKGGKPIFGYRTLHDPKAEHNFFEKIVDKIRVESANQFKILLLRWNIDPNRVNDYFELRPKEFKDAF